MPETSGNDNQNKFDDYAGRTEPTKRKKIDAPTGFGFFLFVISASILSVPALVWILIAGVSPRTCIDALSNLSTSQTILMIALAVIGLIAAFISSLFKAHTWAVVVLTVIIVLIGLGFMVGLMLLTGQFDLAMLNIT